TVPPHVVAANRIQLATLIATNFFGQNAPAIAATESCYAEMWAQDATAMYGYAAASSAATTLTPFTHPPRTTTAHGQAAQAAAVSHAADSQPPGWSSLVDSVSGFNTVVTTPGQSFFAAARTLLGWGQFGTGLNLANIQAAKAAAGAVRLPAAVAGPSVSGGLGRAATVGRLSVPPAWPAANPVAPLGETVMRQPGGMVRLVSGSAPDSPAGPGIPPALRTADRSAGVPVLRNGRRAFRMPRPAYGG
ncbi:PPE family protein, partial [Mycobacterium avium]